jgi:hypothetical protein
MSFQTIDQGFRFLGVREDFNLLLTWGGDEVGTLITRLVILHSDWSSGSRDSIVALQWSFLHALS